MSVVGFAVSAFSVGICELHAAFPSRPQPAKNRLFPCLYTCRLLWSAPSGFVDLSFLFSQVGEKMRPSWFRGEERSATLSTPNLVIASFFVVIVMSSPLVSASDFVDMSFFFSQVWEKICSEL